MKLKPKSTVLHPRAIWYRRFTDLQTAIGTASVFRVAATTASGFEVIYWYYFDRENYEFHVLDVVPTNATQIELRGNTWYTAGGFYFRFTASSLGNDNYEIKEVRLDEKPENVDLLQIKGYSSIGKYQLNRYYASGSFDFMIKGSITGTTTQRLKGNIIPLTSMNIVHYNDSIQLEPDDLVVVEGRLYSVENPEVEHKHQPKPFNVYYATLNSIL